MNIYCSKCKQELEIEKDLGTEIYVFGHDCNSQEQETEEVVDDFLRVVLDSAED